MYLYILLSFTTVLPCYRVLHLQKLYYCCLQLTILLDFYQNLELELELELLIVDQ